MPLSTGAKLGPYEIVSAIGKGGMGEVWRARDPRLGRDVAIKVSAQQFTDRFEREARAIAALNHTNICTLYDVGPNYLVMEYIEGPTLADRIAQSRVSLEEALAIAKQIAEALEAAHEKGIVHRDLKPANVKIRLDGSVKVLDFGLAKAAGEASAVTADSPTMMPGTQIGMIMGTAGYMSPEQASGKPVDKRADIWSFGVVLWELLTGRRLFEGETVSHTLAAVLTQKPDWTKLPSGLPASVRRLLRRCLERDLKRRLPDLGSARLEIEEALEPGTAEGSGPEIPASPKPVLAWALFAAAAVAALTLAFVHFLRPTEASQILKMSVLPPEDVKFDDFGSVNVSPDGRHLDFVAILDAKRGLWVRDLDSLAARLLPGTEGADGPFWSPDSRFIGFFTDGKLKKIDVTGGPAVTLCDAPDARGGSWSQRDVILFAPTNSSGLFRVAAAGGTATPVTEPDRALGEASHRFPWFLPDGRHFLYSASGFDRTHSAIYAGDLDSRARAQVVAVNSNAEYAPPGSVLFLQKGTLMAQPFDVATLKTTADAVPVAEQIRYSGNAIMGDFSASQNGVLLYLSRGGEERVNITWFDRSGNKLGTVGPPGEKEWANISPDGNTVAMDRRDPQTGVFDIWLNDLARGTSSRFTSGPGENRFPIWSPDGSHVAFFSPGNGGAVHQRAISGTARDEVLDKGPTPRRAEDWSGDGRYLIEVQIGGKDIWVLPLFGDRKPFAYLQGEFRAHTAKFSPDGQWMAYSSNETGRDEVYVVTFPSPTSKSQVSTSGGQLPVWSRDGKELFFVSGDQRSGDRELMAAEIRGAGPKFSAGRPKALFALHLAQLNPWYDVSKDGRFLIPTRIEQPSNPPITVVVNWQAGLKK